MSTVVLVIEGPSEALESVKKDMLDFKQQASLTLALRYIVPRNKVLDVAEYLLDEYFVDAKISIGNHLVKVKK